MGILYWMLLLNFGVIDIKKIGKSLSFKMGVPLFFVSCSVVGVFMGVLKSDILYRYPHDFLQLNVFMKLIFSFFLQEKIKKVGWLEFYLLYVSLESRFSNMLIHFLLKFLWLHKYVKFWFNFQVLCAKDAYAWLGMHM